MSIAYEVNLDHESLTNHKTAACLSFVHEWSYRYFQKVDTPDLIVWIIRMAYYMCM